MNYLIIDKEEWDRFLGKLLSSYTVFASVSDEFGQDYELIKPEDISRITYNKPKPATPLKSFFLPVKENVTSGIISEKPRLIIGTPNCDIQGLKLLDEIYLDKDFLDILYKRHRDNTVLISSDCFGVGEHCHCLSYNIMPYSTENADLAIISMSGKIVLRILSTKGENFVKEIPVSDSPENDKLLSSIEKEHLLTETSLKAANKGLPDSAATGKLVRGAGEEVWKKHSARCVSCGACTTICPTCTCFLLIDKPGFEKVKQMDACQYPGFERTAGGEDGLFELPVRFRNRYMCKYAWKSAKFRSTACTGCGRCIEACLGKINKNEIFMELAKS
ncbi:MAG: 4Fe-4S dicluster domain-containing protein [Bacteroidia bacterium]|nr:4Fe-4S dicluster domain-containing protein [Bacteroidia bacterium]